MSTAGTRRAAERAADRSPHRAAGAPLAVFPEAGEPERANVGALLRARAAEAPERACARIARAGGGFDTWSYREVDERSDAIAAGLAARGLAPGDRAALFVPPGPSWIAIAWALFKLGAVPVLVDPRMGRARLLACVERAAPRALVGVARAQLARRLFPRAFRSVELAVAVGRSLLGERLERIARPSERAPELAPTAPDEVAAIVFTSGSTGPPKGVLATERNLFAQVAALRALYDLRPGEVDLACFPGFALFDAALGATSVFPAIDATRPASADPERVAHALEASGATFAFASPAIWRRLEPWARARGARFASLRRLFVAGAPIAPALVEALRALTGDGDVHVPYGATEALPLASVSGAELESGLGARVEAGEGTCVGRAAPGVEIAIAPIDDGPIARLAPGDALEPGELGEVCARGPQVSRAYAGAAEADRLAKIDAGEEATRDAPVWHRTGDLGRLDADGLLWYAGRKSQRLRTAAGTLPPVPTENVYATHAEVGRCALVGVGESGRERPWLVVEPRPGAPLPRGRRAAELAGSIRAHGAERGAPAEVDGVLFHPRFPVDRRHEAKIHREELREWARGRAERSRVRGDRSRVRGVR